MSSVNAGWKPLEVGTTVLTYRYSFGAGIGHALAVRGAQGIIVVSPPCRVPDAAFTELESHGEVVALVASNAFHHLGLPVWKARYPKAELFAPAQSIRRVTKRSKLPGIRPLSDAASLAGPDVELIDMPHYRTGEVLVRIRSGNDLVWYTTDVIMNMRRLPPFPVGTIFKWTGSAPGLRLNGLNPLFMMKDKRALWRWLKELAEREPPTWLVPCHGDRVRLEPGAPQLMHAIAERVP